MWRVAPLPQGWRGSSVTVQISQPERQAQDHTERQDLEHVLHYEVRHATTDGRFSEG